LEVSTAAKGKVNKLKKRKRKEILWEEMCKRKNYKWQMYRKNDRNTAKISKKKLNIVRVLMNLSSIQVSYIQVYPVLEYKYAGATAISPITQSTGTN
jgi:hypothetical protein